MEPQTKWALYDERRKMIVGRETFASETLAVTEALRRTGNLSVVELEIGIVSTKLVWSGRGEW